MQPAVERDLTFTLPAPVRESAPGVETVIESKQRHLIPDVRELWNHRELLLFLVWRDIKVRYQQTVLGATWAILQPLLTMFVFALLFGRVAKLPSDNIPYPLFVYTALLPWQLFAFAMTESSNSLVSNQHLIRKVYFPRLIIPLSAVLVGLVDFAISMVVLIGMMIFYGFRPAGTILLVLPFLVLAVMTALGVGFWLSALNIKYRDVKYAIPFLAQFWMFATPVAYSSKVVPPEWRTLYGLNPMTGVVDGFRWALLGSTAGSGTMLLISFIAVVCVLLSGIAYFKHMERTFADMV